MHPVLCRLPGARRDIAPLLGILVVLAATPAKAEPARVDVKAGNVVVIQDGKQRQLTKSGKDAGPVLAPDGKWVAFTRTGNPDFGGGQGDCKSGAQADELRRIKIDGSGDELLVRGRSDPAPEKNLCDFSRKQFTSDGRSLYFLSPAWATSSALHRFDTVKKALTFVIAANDVIVLNACKKTEYRDNLAVQQHRYLVFGGSYDWYWLYDAAGKKEKGPIGDYENEQGVREVIEGSGFCEP